MKNAIKGACLSGLLFPGLGQLALKQRKRGWAFLLMSVIGLVVFVAIAVRQALLILERVQREGGVVDTQTLSTLAAQSASASDGFWFYAAGVALLLSWILSTVDAYRIGRQLDRSQS